jgi:hypothetical protein
MEIGMHSPKLSSRIDERNARFSVAPLSGRTFPEERACKILGELRVSTVGRAQESKAGVKSKPASLGITAPALWGEEISRSRYRRISFRVAASADQLNPKRFP